MVIGLLLTLRRMHQSSSQVMTAASPQLTVLYVIATKCMGLGREADYLAARILKISVIFSWLACNICCFAVHQQTANRLQVHSCVEQAQKPQQRMCHALCRMTGLAGLS